MSGLPKAVAWDIDGTLIDSEPLHLAALVEVSMRYGLDLSHEPEDRFRGRHMGDVWRALRAFYPGHLTEQLWADAIIDTYIESAPSLRPIPGALETMLELRARGIRQACVSNSERRVVDANLQALGVHDLIEFSISRDDVTAGKPDPEPYLEACRRLGLAPHDVLAVEDSDPGALSAQAAGLKVLRIDAGAPNFQMLHLSR
ncbi:MAG TPA: HAD family phosphatase [Ancylobacter sp.]